MSERRCVGIDVSAHEITVAVGGRAGRTTLTNDAAGHAKLVRLITRGKAIARVCLEWTPFVSCLPNLRGRDPARGYWLA